MAKKKGKKEKGVKTEAQLLKDEEARRKLMDEIKIKAKEKQTIEERHARINLLKIQNKWRELMKLAKSVELRGQVEILKHVHDRHTDQKNSSISNLEKTIEEAEEQFATALQAHCINTDTLIDLQLGRLATLQEQYQGDLQDLEAEFHVERAKLQTQHAKEKAEIMGIMTRMEQEFQDAEADAKHEYSSMKDDVKNKVKKTLTVIFALINTEEQQNLEEKHALRIQLEGTVEDLWRQFQAALNQYNASTEERKKQFEELKQKDQKNAKEIELQMKKLVKLQETISQYKSKLSSNSKEFDERNKALKGEKEAIQIHFQALKKRMNAFRDQERRRLTELTLQSSKVIKDLDAKVEKAEKIIKLAEMNRKFETEFEKVLPFYNSTVEDMQHIDASSVSKNPTSHSPQ
ncbi:Dynein regulatory complex subunit 2 [Blyttiomyces sp. JEL0837]|nr:Dynein regulatory complex subunit 2 [Blyttiomyces sp. JEL0837]